MQLLQFESPLYSMSLKPWFDKVIAKNKMVQFFDSHGSISFNV